MGLGVTIPAALGAIRALIRFRGRVDQILAVRQASAGLPFALPPAPPDVDAHVDAMLDFFATDEGALILELRGLTDTYDDVRAAPTDFNLFEQRLTLVRLYSASTDVALASVGPDAEETDVGASPEMRLAYYVVSSHRLSRNPALTRVLLAAADTVLEFAGDNAALFVSNPKTRPIVETLLQEFAGRDDFDDASGELVLKSLLRASVIAATEHGHELSDEPAVTALFGALADARTELGDDRLAELITSDGFPLLVGKYLTHVAKDPFFTGDARLRAVLGPTLQRLGEDFPAIVADPAGLRAVLEVALAATADQLGALAAKRIGGRPLLAAVVAALAEEVEAQAEDHALLAAIGSGALLGDLAQAALGAVARNPGKLAKAAGIDALAAELVAGVADVLSVTDGLSDETVRRLASTSLGVLARHPSALAGDSAFATAVVAAVMGAAAGAVEDGLDLDDLADVADAALAAATENLGRVDMADELRVILGAVGTQLAERGVRKLLSPEARAEVVFAVVAAVAKSPTIWKGFAEADLVQPLVVALVEGLASDRTKLLSGETMVAAVAEVLGALGRRGRAFLDEDVDDAQLRDILKLALRAAEKEIGVTLDGENLPAFLRRVVLAFLAAPFDTTNKRVTSPEVAALVDEAKEAA